MYLTGIGITVNNANIKNNNNAGLVIGNIAENNKITFDGDITVTNNGIGFAVNPSAQGTAYVTGNLNSNLNRAFGVGTFSEEFTLVVGGSYSGKSGKSGGSGSLTACDNNSLDIFNFKEETTFEGTDYTCDTNPGLVPKCKPCHPGCPSPEPDESSSETQQMASVMAEAEYLELTDMRNFIVRN